ncbi:MAG: flavodoxin domain-containing protein [Gemmobacter sp.]
MKILIAYATTDGQTRKIARFVADRIADLGHGVELLSAADGEGLEPARFDGAILAGSLHAGGFQKSLAAFARAQAEALGAMPTLFLAVSLSAAGTDPEDWAGLRACLATFEAETGWHPGETLHVAGAFRFSEYDFFRAWAMRRIAEKKGEAVDPHADKEYTDWDALGRSVDAWLGRLGG